MDPDRDLQEEPESTLGRRPDELHAPAHEPQVPPSERERAGRTPPEPPVERERRDDGVHR